MTVKEKAKQALQSGITPVRLMYYPARFTDDINTVLRSFIVIESLDLGVLTPEQYRFVARRTKQGEALVEKHIEKLFTGWKEFMALNKNIKAVTIPVYPKVLKDGKLSKMLFDAFVKYPDVDESKICVEFSADILYEETEELIESLIDLKGQGIKIAISEVGDEFCPLIKLASLKADMVFADSLKLEKLDPDDTATVQLIKYLHLDNTKVFAPLLYNDEQIALAKASGFDGFTDFEPYIPNTPTQQTEDEE